VGATDCLGDHPFHRFVALVEQCSQLGGVAVDAENQLGEIVGPDREAVETVREFWRSPNRLRR
jgi:hypothetical protein